jgi:carnosine synthase
VIYARELVNEGDKVVSVTDGMPTWICEIAVHKRTVREAIEYVKAVEHQIDLDIRPAAAKA